jgi:hypothetical protein
LEESIENKALNMRELLRKRQYEFLLFALIQHLYVGIIVRDMPFYLTVLWPLNMVILGLASSGVFLEKGLWKKVLKNILVAVVVLFPLLLPFFSGNALFMLMLNISYVVFFSYIFIEVFVFLIRPSYINTDIISAAACGMFLLIEIFVFLFQIWVYEDPNSFKGLGTHGTPYIFTDLVYYCSITVTTIGYGDITPNTHYTKLATALLGIAGQFYSVVLVGIIISKFSSKTN